MAETIPRDEAITKTIPSGELIEEIAWAMNVTI